MLLLATVVLAMAAPAAADSPPMAWLEATPLFASEAPAVVVEPAAEASFGERDFEPGLWLVCAGAEGLGLSCDSVHVEPGGRPAAPVLAPGVEVTGIVRVGRFPAVEAHMALVPAQLRSRRRVTLPLGWEERERELSREAVTDEKGRFTLPPLSPGDYRLEIRLPGGRLVHPEPFTVPPPEHLLPRGRDPRQVQAVLDLGELSMDDGLRVEVLVTDEGGAPIPGAQVGGSQGERLDTVFFETRAGEDGVAVLTGIDPALPLSLVCVASGYARMRSTFDVVPATTTCILPKLALVRGRVLDPDEEPLSEGVVQIEGGDRSATTGDDGGFELPDLPARPYHLVVSAPGYRVEEIDVELAAGQELELPPVVLLPGEELAGRVVARESGEPVAGASVRATAPPGRSATTDEDGTFAVTVDPERAVTLEVTAAGFAPLTSTLAAGSADQEEPVRLELDRGGRIRVVADDPAEEGPCVGCAFLVEGAGVMERLVTDGAGQSVSELVAAGEYRVAGVRERSLGGVVTVQTGDNAKQAAVEPGEITTVRFESARDTLTVRVFPSPPPGWRLSADGPGWSRQLDLQDGTAVLRREPGEAVELSLWRPGGASTHVAGIPPSYDEPRLDVELPPAGVSGRLLRESEAPAAGVLLRLLSPTGEARATVLTGVDGSFHVSHLAPGVYTLAAGDRPLATVQVGHETEELGPVVMAASDIP